ncbi:MAG: DapH/DapD/GlmU-related protein [Polyangiaceae bacterium]
MLKLLRDTLELARVANGDTSLKSIGRALVLDAWPILALSRVRETARSLHVPGVNRALRMAQMVLYGVEIGKDVELGAGVYLVHSLGTVIGGTSRVGERVRFMGNNTVGTAKENGCPVIEDDVVVGCGARILGPIHIGKGATIGANAVVLSDVPANAVVVGSPAREVARNRTPKQLQSDENQG